jgi:hypothetical protein
MTTCVRRTRIGPSNSAGCWTDTERPTVSSEGRSAVRKQGHHVSADRQGVIPGSRPRCQDRRRRHSTTGAVSSHVLGTEEARQRASPPLWLTACSSGPKGTRAARPGCAPEGRVLFVHADVSGSEDRCTAAGNVHATGIGPRRGSARPCSNEYQQSECAVFVAGTGTGPRARCRIRRCGQRQPGVVIEVVAGEFGRRFSLPVAGVR